MTADDPRIHLIVLFGGQSAEHDVSCTSATHVLRAANPSRYRITPVGIGRDGRWMVADDAVAALMNGPAAIPDRLIASGTPTSLESLIAPGHTTVVVPLLHGPMGEDGTMQGLLELTNVAYVGSGVLASAVAMDKAMAKDLAAHHGLPQARHVSLRADRLHPGSADELIGTLGLPLFVKPANMGSSVGVSKAKDADQLKAARSEEHTSELQSH